jgi:hypothetical protein
MYNFFANTQTFVFYNTYLGFRIGDWESGFRIHDLGFGIWESGIRIQDSGFGIWEYK